MGLARSAISQRQRTLLPRWGSVLVRLGGRPTHIGARLLLRSVKVPSRLGSGHRSPVAVDVGSVVNAQDLDPISGVVDVVEDPVRAPTGAVGAFEFSLERLADLSGCPREVAEDELDDRRNDSWRDAAQVPARGGREDHLITHRSPLGTLNSARICSSL